MTYEELKLEKEEATKEALKNEKTSLPWIIGSLQGLVKIAMFELELGIPPKEVILILQRGLKESEDMWDAYIKQKYD